MCNMETVVSTSWGFIDKIGSNNEHSVFGKHWHCIHPAATFDQSLLFPPIKWGLGQSWWLFALKEIKGKHSFFCLSSLPTRQVCGLFLFMILSQKDRSVLKPPVETRGRSLLEVPSPGLFLVLEMAFNGWENTGFQHRAHTPTFLTIIFVFHNSVRGKQIRN